MMQVAVLLTVFNRREKTLACLDEVFRQADALKALEQYSFKVWMTDDGCTDGTPEAVRQRYPHVNILQGGNLYWNRGMRLAWDAASAEDPDFYLWIHDDTMLRDGALAVLLETSTFLRHKAIVVGTAAGAEGALSYGGRAKSDKIVEPDPDIPVSCWTFNGNLVLVPRAVWKVLGNLDPGYSHSYGDFDYGVRAVKAGITRAVAPGVLADCPRNPGVEPWRSSSQPLARRYKFLLSPKGRPPREQFRYDVRSSGFFWAVAHMISINFKVLFPKRDA